MPNLDHRFEQLKNWLNQNMPCTMVDIYPIVNDASFRRYFRVLTKEQSWIAMDAPPAKEDCHTFSRIAQDLWDLDIKVPKIIAKDLDQGYLLLTDFGDKTLLSQLCEENVSKLYELAIKSLLQLQACKPMAYLPQFNANYIAMELQLFLEWFVKIHLKIDLSLAEQKIIEDAFTFLIKKATEQPQIIIHRDFHSRNLMLLADDQIGVLDFQDAMVGPLTYDLVSLLKDCYIAWPMTKIKSFIEYYFNALKSEFSQMTQNEFLSYFDLMGLQRHLKVLGIFARLKYRDGKLEHIKNVPRILNYIDPILKNYKELSPFKNLMHSLIQPEVQRILA